MNPDIVVSTANDSVEKCAGQVIEFLIEKGYLVEDQGREELVG